MTSYFAALFIVVLILACVITFVCESNKSFQHKLERMKLELEVEMEYIKTTQVDSKSGIQSLSNKCDDLEKQIGIVRNGCNMVSDNLTLHIASNHADVSKNANGSWNIERKNECVDFILKNKEVMTYKEMSVILCVPASTLKRWAHERLDRV